MRIAVKFHTNLFCGKKHVRNQQKRHKAKTKSVKLKRLKTSDTNRF